MSVSFKGMTQDQIYEVWRMTQLQNRAAGLPHYLICSNIKTGEIYATIDNDGRGTYDAKPEPCGHESVDTRDGAYCQHCGETLA